MSEPSLAASSLASKHQAKGRQPAALPSTGLGPVLPLYALPPYTQVTNQFAGYGIVFTGGAPNNEPVFTGGAPLNPPVVINDGSNGGAPDLGSAWCAPGYPVVHPYATVTAQFVRPGTDIPTTVNDFSLDVQGIDNPGSTEMIVYDSKHQQLGVLTAAQAGNNIRLESTFPGAASFTVTNPADEPCGWGLSVIQVGTANLAYVALGDSYSSGEGTQYFPWSGAQGTQCDTGPEAWPAQMAANSSTRNSSGPLVTAGLIIDQDTLIACQGETTSDLNVAVNGESNSELGQLTDYVASHGPPDLVTITIGGNDLGFASILKACFLGGTEVCLHVVNALEEKVTTGAASLIATLASTYREVSSAAGAGSDSAAAPRVVVVGYPDLFPSSGIGLRTPIIVTHNCPWLRFTPILLGTVSPFLNTLLDDMLHAQAALNDDMAAAAAEAGVEFVPIPYSLSGHQLCTDTPFINPLTLIGGIAGDRNLGHPNAAGQAAIANAVGSQLGFAPGSSGGARAHLAVPTASARGHRLRLTPGGGPLNFPGGRLAAGTVGGAYIDYLIATGGTGADTWSITKGSLPPGLSLSPAAGTVTGTPATRGRYRFTVQAADSSAPPQTASAPVTITVTAAAPLAVGASTPPDATTGQVYAFPLAATGGLGALRWAITSGALPAGLNLNAATGQITGTPTAAGTSSFTVSAKDSSSPRQVATASESITVNPSSAPLAVTTVSMPEVAAGQNYSTQLTSTGGAAPVRWSVSAGALPSGLSLDPAAGLLGGTPTAAGTYTFTVEVTDATAPLPQMASKQLSITIGAAPRLTITTPNLPSGAEGTYYSASIQATGGAGSDQWSVSPGSLPAGLSLNPGTGQITGTPSGIGTFSFGVTVTDAAGSTVSQSYSVTVVPNPLTASSVLPRATVGTGYVGNVAPSGGQAPYTWSLLSGTLPPGLAFNAADGTIAGTPTQAGAFPLQVAVSDSSSPAQQVTVNLTLTVNAPPQLQVSAQVPVPVAIGVPYTALIGFSGGQYPYTWTVTSGSLPPGLTLGQAMIGGTPTTAGTYPVTIQVTDSSSPVPQTASASFNFTINPNPPTPVITTTTLPVAATGVPYRADLNVVAPPGYWYWWTLGKMDFGLNYPGQVTGNTAQIFGTPLGPPGTDGLTLQIRDINSNVLAQRPINLTVDPGPPPAILTTGLPDAIQGSPYCQSLTAEGAIAPYQWALVRGTLPPGLQLDGSSCDIQGTPSQFGLFTFTVSVTESAMPAQAPVTKQLSINVEAPFAGNHSHH
jgi:lysophospholipase L1-like esterase